VLRLQSYAVKRRQGPQPAGIWMRTVLGLRVIGLAAGHDDEMKGKAGSFFIGPDDVATAGAFG